VIRETGRIADTPELSFFVGVNLIDARFALYVNDATFPITQAMPLSRLARHFR
jgi:hypothetical protein